MAEQTNHWISKACEALASSGWYYGSGVLGEEMVRAIEGRLEALSVANAFAVAGIGRGSEFQLNDSVRRDSICWFDTDSQLAVDAELKGLLSAIRLALNAALYTGLESFEGHFAIYPPAGYYARHVDTFRSSDSRTMTLIIYLNRHWRFEHGGQLRLYVDAEDYLDLPPTAGSVVMFNSRKFQHEVIPAGAERRSFTGWFKVRPVNGVSVR